MAWVIDRDYGWDADPSEDIGSRVGTGQWGIENQHGDPKPNMPFRFRLRDEDGEIYYGGRYDQDAMDNDEEWGGLYNALKFGEWDVGATILEVKAEEWGGKHAAENADKDGWYVPYG